MCVERALQIVTFIVADTGLAQFASLGRVRRRPCAAAQFSSCRPLGDLAAHEGGRCRPRPRPDNPVVHATARLFSAPAVRAHHAKSSTDDRQGLSAYARIFLFFREAAPCAGLCPAIYPVCASAQSSAWRLNHGVVLLPSGGRAGGKFEVRDEPS